MPQNAAGRLVEGVEDPGPRPDVYVSADHRGAGEKACGWLSWHGRRSRHPAPDPGHRGRRGGVIAVAAEFSEEWAGPFR